LGDDLQNLVNQITVRIKDGNAFAVFHALPDEIKQQGALARAGCADDMLVASAAALAVFCIAGYKAAKRSKGPGTFIVNLRDELACLSPNEVVPLANIRLL
jgi:hypothetical protein